MQPALLNRLHQDHGRLARILEALESKAAQARSGVRGATLDTLATLVDYIAEYPDAVHHPLEDRVFAELLRKELTDQERRLVADNAGQHEQLTAATRRLVAAIESLLARSDDAGAALQADVDRYVEIQRQHMRHEEELVFPLALARFSDADWDRLAQDDAEAHDPLFDQRLSRFESLYEYAVTDTEAARHRERY